jgi:site-specific DNA recombinase
VPGRIRTSKGWSPATVGRILDNQKYVGRWIWNRSETRRDPRTGRRRRFGKPESDWIVQADERLRIIPQDLWEAVRTRRKAVRRSWPGEQRRGFSSAQGSRQQHFPTHLLSGTMICGACGGAIAQVSGKSGGYYGCLAASKSACENKILVRRSLTEKVILSAVRYRLSHPADVARVLERVEQAVGELRSDLPENIRLKEAERASEERRLANFLAFVGEGRGSRALAQALEETERRVDGLKRELDALRSSREKVFRSPPLEWITERMDKLQEVLERNTARSALLLRQFLGPIRLEPVRADIGRPYYRAITAIDTLALIQTPFDPEGPEGGSNSLRWWR